MKRLTVGSVLFVLIALDLVGPAAVYAQEPGTLAATPTAATTASVFLVIANDGCMADRLVGATTDVADAVEMHQTSKEDDAVAMRPLPDGLEIPAGDTVRLEPKGDHLILMGLRKDLAARSSFLLTLTFEFNGDIAVPVTVRDDRELSAGETPPAPVAVGTIQVADAWMQAVRSLSGTPAATGP